MGVEAKDNPSQGFIDSRPRGWSDESVSWWERYYKAVRANQDVSQVYYDFSEDKSEDLVEQPHRRRFTGPGSLQSPLPRPFRLPKLEEYLEED